MVGSTRLCRALALYASLSCGSVSARPNSLISVLTHSDQVFLGLPFPVQPVSIKFVTDLIWDLAHCTCPHHLSRPLRRTAIIPIMPSFLSSEDDGVSSWTLVPQIQQIMAQSLRQSRFRSKVFGLHVLLPRSIADQTQAESTLPCTLGEKCLEVRPGNSFLNSPQPTQHLAAMAPSQPPPEHSISPR